MNHPPVDQQITFLYTRNLEAATAFYQEVMGLALVVDQGGCHIYRLTDQAYLGICERETADTTGVIFTLVSDDVDGWYAHLLAKGAKPEAAPKVNPDYGIYHFYLRDPDGHLLEIQRFLDPEWNRLQAD